MNKLFKKLLFLVAGVLFSTAVTAATCTSKASGSWTSTSVWTCTGTPVLTIPDATTAVIIASPNTVTLVGSVSVASLTVNSGATLSDTGGNALTITGNLTNNGTLSTTNSGQLNVTGSASVISGNGTYDSFRLYTSGATPQIAAGAVLSFSGDARLYAGRNEGGSTIANSVLTINGTINSTVAASNTTFMRLYANSTVIGSTGVINAGVSSVSYNTSTAKVTNNGSVSVSQITQNTSSNGWTQGANSSLTVTAVSTLGVLSASATGNTVTYGSPATPITPSGNTYYNLAGSGVRCPHGFNVLGTDPCGAVSGSLSVTMSPGNCTSVTGIGNVAWSSAASAAASDNNYASARVNGTTNYLKCTGYNFAIPATATILGISVDVERHSSSSSRTTDGAMRLVKAGVIGTADRSTATVYSKSDVIEAHGSAFDLWGGAWTPADINLATFGAAFAVKTTKTRTVSVDHMPITVTYSAATAGPHHIQIEHDGAGQTCRAEVLTVKACADAACTSNFTAASVTGNVTWAGSPGGAIPFSTASGQTTVSLPVSTAQTVTLGVSGVSPAPTTSQSCVNLGGGAACSVVFTGSSVCFDAVEAGAASNTTLFTKLSGTPFSLDVVANTSYSGTLTVSLVDASSGSCATYASLNSQSASFSNQLRKTLNFSYPNAARSVKVRITGQAGASCSADKFAIRPQSLTVSSSANADGTGSNTGAAPTVKAGAAFALTATGVSGYNGTPLVDPNRVMAHAAAPVTGAVAGAFGAAGAATGAATGSGFTYDEVGYFRFDVNGVYDSGFTAVDQPGDCTNDFSNTRVGGKYGCKFGNAAASSYFGRFIPDHFETVVTDECGTFTYSGQPFPLEIVARDTAGATTANYDGGFSRAVILSDALNAPSPGSFTPATVAAGSFASGLMTMTPGYAFTAVKTAPTVIGVRAAEAAGGDGVGSAGFAEGQTEIRSGRVWAGNAYGSELLDLPVPLRAQYWNGSAFVTNIDDDVTTCTSFLAPVVTLLPGGTAVTATMNNDPDVPGNVGFVAGDGGLVLSAPGVAGYADVTPDLPAWLQYAWSGAGAVNPTGRATFGVYGGNSVFIYRGRRGR